MTPLLIALLFTADGSTVHVTSNPTGATVMLDATELGVTPLDAQIPPGKHTLTVTVREFEPMKRALKNQKAGETLAFDFVKERLKQLEVAIARAQKSYDAAEARLIKAQQSDSNVEGAEAKMRDAVKALETAERELDEFKKARRLTK